jgi:hypothetical protein
MLSILGDRDLEYITLAVAAVIIGMYIVSVARLGQMALGAMVVNQRPMAEVAAALTAALQPLLAPGEIIGLGLVVGLED